MIINSIGKTVPPVFFFRRARHHDLLMFGAPPGSLGSVIVLKTAEWLGLCSWKFLNV